MLPDCQDSGIGGGSVMFMAAASHWGLGMGVGRHWVVLRGVDRLQGGERALQRHVLSVGGSMGTDDDVAHL